MYPPTRYPYRPRPQIFKLPPETLAYIFWVAVTSADTYDRREFPIRYKIRTAIRLVCRPWNQNVLSTTHLWTRFAVDVSIRESRYPSILDISLWLRRAGDMLPIDVLVAMPNDQSSIRAAHIRGVFNVLSQNINRWRELWFESDIGVDGFPINLSLAANLTKLSIDAGVLDDDAITAIGPAFRNFRGRLFVLNLEHVTFDWISSWMEQYEMPLDWLRSLTMQYEGWMHGVWYMLSEAQDNLISANIHVDGQFSQSSEYLVFGQDVSVTALSRLRDLRLEIFDADLGIFSYLEMESLQELYVSVSWSSIVPRDERDITPLVEFIESGLHSLRTCQLWCDRVRSKWITELFSSPILFNIPTYQICNVKFGPDTTHLLDTSASPTIRHRLGRVSERNPGHFTVGWTNRWD